VGGTVAGILLAAGAGTRMGSPKGLLRMPDGTPWVTQAVAALATGGCAPIFAVTGARAEQVQALVPALAEIVVVRDWAEGLSASLRAGLRAAQQQAPSAVAVIVALVDTPGVTADAVGRLHRLAGPAVLARAGYDGVPGHPVLIGREHWTGVIETAAGDAGARDYLAGHDVVLVESGDVASGTDIDTPDQLDSAATSAERPPPLILGAVASQLLPDTSRLAPPARRVVRARVTENPLDVAAHTAAVEGPSSGAVVSFAGVVRDHDGGRAVTSIEYVGHPTADAVLARVVAEVTAQSSAEAVAVSHRLGPLAVGEVALVVAVAGVHRAEAFATAMLLVDEVKRQLPVWKRQIFPDGTDEWVACP
jgi:molybdopterin synthase catalytic subunit